MAVQAGKGWGLGHGGQPGQLWTVGEGEGRGGEGRGGEAGREEGSGGGDGDVE